MRARVRIRRADDGAGWVLSPGSDQLALLRRCTDAFRTEMPDRAQRDFVLGEHGESLPALFAADPAAAADAGLPVTEGALRAAHTLLVTLLALIPSERAFVERTGHYRDHVTAVAYGIRRAASAQ
ncbi:hypothetical protein OG345_14130 [Streptomyces sp. NBC_01220]|uniref:hypothetical protein n=1 Tax=Streptomyces sp. NBC_01220 TaxID=2903781 RepID=UPI00352CA8C3|nr:hypothetical protein OG345_14130 [Streptomyces sp. NBC_01220]